MTDHDPARTPTSSPSTWPTARAYSGAAADSSPGRLHPCQIEDSERPRDARERDAAAMLAGVALAAAICAPAILAWLVARELRGNVQSYRPRWVL